MHLDEAAASEVVGSIEERERNGRTCLYDRFPDQDRRTNGHAMAKVEQRRDHHRLIDQGGAA